MPSGDATRLITEMGTILCETLVTVTEAGVERIDAVVTGSGGTYNLSDSIVDDDCVGTGNAVFPDVRGDQVAFFASTEAIGRAGTDRLEPPYDLYLLDLTDRSVSPLGLRVLDPYSLI